MPTVMEMLDAILLSLILLFYGVSDVGITLYGMKYHDMNEGNWIHHRLFGEKMRWYQSVGAKSIMLGFVFTIYYISRVQYTSKMYQILWWVVASAIVIQGLRVSYLNLQDIYTDQ